VEERRDTQRSPETLASLSQVTERMKYETLDAMDDGPAVSGVSSGCSSTNWVGREDESAVYQAPGNLRGHGEHREQSPGTHQPAGAPCKKGAFLRETAHGSRGGRICRRGYGVGRIVAGAFDIVTAPILVPSGRSSSRSLCHRTSRSGLSERSRQK